MDISVDAIDDLENPFVVDVRSPGEFKEDHLPGAVNLPVLDNDERDRIGTLYHRESTFEARREGAKTICENVPEIVDTIDKNASSERPLLLYCWRGGQRSRSLAIILEQIGYNVFRLEGGYKAYRRRVHDFLRNAEWSSPVVALFGYTGSGKTAMLHRLADRGHSTLDLEGAANHRGSAFGGVGLGNQPSQKTFERNLYTQLKDSSPPVFSEGESRKIGRRLIPDPLFDELGDPPRIWIEVPRETRVVNIREDYPWRDHRDTLVEKIGNLRERLGADRVDSLQSKLEEDQLSDVIETLLKDYYDPAYEKSCPDSEQFDYTISADTVGDAVSELDKIADTIGSSTTVN